LAGFDERVVESISNNAKEFAFLDKRIVGDLMDTVKWNSAKWCDSKLVVEGFSGRRRRDEEKTCEKEPSEKEECVHRRDERSA
jgi:hypothetical protein